MTDEFEAKPGTAVHMPLLSEALINFAFNQAQEFVESGNSVRESTSICANLLLDAAWKVAGAGAAADGFEPDKDKFRARVEDVLERVSFSKLDDEGGSSDQPSASAEPSPDQPPPTGMAVMQDGALNLAFVANALRFYANHIEGHPQRGDYFPADLRLAAEMLIAGPPPPQTHVMGRWLPIEQADKTINHVTEFTQIGLTLKNSDTFWVRDEDGRVYEAAWSEGNKGRDYWWDWEAESPVDPVEFMPHPLDPRFAALATTEGSEG